MTVRKIQPEDPDGKRWTDTKSLVLTDSAKAWKEYMERPAGDSGSDRLTDMETDGQTDLGSQQRQRQSCCCGQGERWQFCPALSLRGSWSFFPSTAIRDFEGLFPGPQLPLPHDPQEGSRLRLLLSLEL